MEKCEVQGLGLVLHGHNSLTRGSGTEIPFVNLSILETSTGMTKEATTIGLLWP